MTTPPTPAAEDKNGHKIDAKGDLVFDERCHGCDAPAADSVLEKVQQPKDIWELFDELDLKLSGELCAEYYWWADKRLGEIRLYAKKLHAENQVMREALEKEIELYGICHEVDCQQYNGTVRPNKRLLCTCKVRRLQEALSQLSSAKSE